MAPGSGDASPDRSALANERPRDADARERRADVRERDADERDRLADVRERVADERDRLADVRERVADERDRQADVREERIREFAAQLMEETRQLVVRAEISAEHANEIIKRMNGLSSSSHARMQRSRSTLERAYAYRRDANLA
jgi:hypothetical protein